LTEQERRYLDSIEWAIATAQLEATRAKELVGVAPYPSAQAAISGLEQIAARLSRLVEVLGPRVRGVSARCVAGD
jgi:hypothetical protein